MKETFAIAVIQTTAVVPARQQQQQQQTLPVLNVLVETDTHILSLIRYIPDLIEFDQMIKKHYQKVKIPFPSLSATDTPKAEKRRSFRQFLTSLSPQTRPKSNSEKIERYLQKCSMDPIVRPSSIFRDFFSVQRDEDRIMSKAELASSPPPLPPTIHQNGHKTQPTAVEDQRSVSEDDDVVVAPDPAPQQQHQIPDDINHNDDVNDDAQCLPETEEKKDEDEEEEEEEETPAADAAVNDPATEQPAAGDHNVELILTTSKRAMLDDFEKLKVLGKGCMGKVFLVRSRKTNELYALKSIMKELVIEQREITHTLAERDILATLSKINHPFLAKLHASFQDENRLYLVSDYYCGGDLATQMSTCTTFSKERTLFYAAEIIEGIGELHRLGILYRDLKPENILLTAEGHVVLTDFGLSKWLSKTDDDYTQTFCGTAEYLAPEALLGEPYSVAIDYWAYGTILYEMLAGITPFWADNHSEMYRRVLQDPLEFPSDIDFETAEFLSGLLERDPRHRLGAQGGVDEIKSHVYFASIVWDDVYHQRLRPPYVPQLKSALDFANFDPTFLEMPPTLTPVGSRVDLVLTDEVQQVFDGYSFVDERFMEKELMMPQEENDSLSEWDDEVSLVKAKRRTMDEINEQQLREHQLYHDLHPTFQPARKRGSVSMLSDIDSFHLDGGYSMGAPAIEPDVTTREELSYYHHHQSKRRNTNGPAEEVDYAYQQQLSESLIVAEPLSKVVAVPDCTLHDFDFGGISADLDLKLSFSLQHDPSTNGGGDKPIKKNKKWGRRKNGARRFFSPLLKL